MKVLVIGGTGFLGRCVVQSLIDDGHEVAVFHRGQTGGEGPSAIRHIRGDRDDLAAHDAAFRAFAPEVVLDVIPYTEQQARDLVAAFRGLAGRLVVISSGDVYCNYDGLRGVGQAPPDPVPLSEEAPLRTSRYPYRGHATVAGFPYRDDYDKILVEQVVLKASELAGTVLRLPALYGPGDRQHRLRPYLQRMGDGRPAILLGDKQAHWRWSRGYVENVAQAVVLAVLSEQAACRVYNVGEPEAMTERAWVEAVGEATGWAGHVVTVPEERLPDGLTMGFDWRYHLALDTRRIRDELGYVEVVSADEALRRTIAWERAQPQEALPGDYTLEDAVLAAIRS